MAKTPSSLSADDQKLPLERLYSRIESSRGKDPSKSYSAKLMARGRAKIAQKLGEEAVETVIELVRDDKQGVIGESADLLYHLLVAWVDAKVKPEDVWAELARRESMSGIDEKAGRRAS